jgi:glucose/arabinose dehydrogenase
VARSRLDGDKLVETRDLFVANNPSDDHAHWGSRVVMDGDRFLFFTSGDRHAPENAQLPSSHGGKVLRIRADGSVPEDNPFAGQADAAPEVWSVGHRNPQGLYIDPATGELLEQEHGPTGGDEINRIRKGANYGWPVISYGKDIWGGGQPQGTERDGLEQPLVYFKPGIAPTGIAVYTGTRIPGWQGSLLSATLRGYMVRLELDGDEVKLEERLLAEWGQRMRDVVEGPDGNLYLATESGKIARVSPVPGGD